MKTASTIKTASTTSVQSKVPVIEEEVVEAQEGEEEPPEYDEFGELIVKVKKVEEKKDPVEEFPEAYKQNSNKEELAIAYAENFRRQYVHLFRDRQPLILYPLNECGIEKLVCTTMRPTLLPYIQLYHWQGCAEFVSDYITMQQLPVAYKVPESLISPTTILKKQTGTCFDMSNLLCCLLLGAGYDAYVVSGYATKEVCLADETREICPLLKPKEEETDEVSSTEQVKKYTVRPARVLLSKFERKMKQREEEKIEQEQEKLRLEEAARLLEAEKPTPDPLYGLRVHSWVLIKAGKREVPDDFFIEPFTGRDHPKTSTSFLGIESVWNNTNYWANMQDCSNGCADLNFNLYNTVYWEYLMEGAGMKDDAPDEETLDGEEIEADEPDTLDVPAPWILPIDITLKQLESRCPEGKKTILYKKSLMEKYADYLLPDGLVTRLLVYNDIEQTQLLRTEEYFSNRVDQLRRRIDEDGFITEEFNEGRPCGLKSHRYRKDETEPFGERTMYFYHHIRVDGMSMRSDTATEMVENYVDREDRRYYRRVLFGPPVKKSGGKDVLQRPILKIEERFSRNPALDANEDVDICNFIIAEDKITLKYHLNSQGITSSTREYFKPPEAEEKGGSLVWSNEMTQAYQVLLPDSKKPSKKTVPVYQNMIDLIRKEQKTIKNVRLSEEETYEILQERIEQTLANELVISVYDTQRNDKALKHRLEQEKIAEEEKNKKKETEMDYLAPFLQQIGCPDRLSSAQAYKLKEDCLADLKQRLIDKANLIQLRFEKETSELHKRQQEYQHKQVAMTKEDEEEYFNYCSEAMFRIHILEMRLNRHKQTAPNKYMAMEQKLRQDKRLSELLL